MKPVPLHVQTQSTECGLASMGMILAHFGRHVDMDTLRRISGVSRDCVDAKDLLRIADHFGLSARVVRTEPDRLHRLGLPLVVFTDFIHFTVVEALDERKVVLADPGFGRHAIPRAEFDESFTGVALSFAPTDRFRPGGRRITLAHRIIRQMGLCPRGLTVAAFAAQALWVMPLLPAILHLAETGVGGGAWMDGSGEDLVRLGLAGLIGTGALLALSAWTAAGAEDRYCRHRLVGMARHVLAQSHAFFVYRVHAVIAQRIGAHDAIAEMLFRRLLPAAGAAVAVPAILVTLAILHLPSAVSAALLAGLHIALNLIADRTAAREGRARQDDRDVHWTKLSHSLENFESFKTSGGDREFFNEAMGLCARRIEVRQRTGLFKGAAEVSADLTFWLLLPAILIGFHFRSPPPELLAPTLIAVTFLAVLLHWPLRAVAGLHGTLDGLRLYLPPLDDLSDSVAEPDTPARPMLWPAGGSSLSLSDVRFGFSSAKPPLFNRITVSVKPGEWVALTGPSGGGKSALAALMIGLHRPWTGAVEMDGRLIQAIGRRDLARRIGWIDKHPFFIPGTIRDNICLWDADVTAADLAAAVADACLDDVVAGFPEGLDTPLAARAANLSGGQRQRVELARALVRNPGLIVIDEATDGLDPDTESRLFGNLRRRGMTVLVVSHRASTIAACDRVMRLSDGGLAPDRSMPSQQPAAQCVDDPYAVSIERADIDPSPPFEDLIATFACVAKASGISAVTSVTPPSEGDAHAGLMYLARQHRLMLRPMRFAVADWWRRDFGPMIGFLRENERPVAVLSDFSGQPVIVDPRNGAYQVVPDDAADRLMPVAYRIYPRFAPLSARLRDFFRLPLRPVRRAIAEIAVADLLLAGLLVCGPWAAYMRIAAGDIHPTVWGGGLALWAAAAVVLFASRLVAQHRVEGVQDLSVHSALYQHLMRIQPFFVRDHAPQEVNRSLQAIPELLALIRGGTARRLAAGLGALTGLATIIYFAPTLSIVAILLLIPFFLIPGWLALVRSTPAAVLLQRRPEGRMLLAGLMQSAAKLRQAARTEAALVAWAKMVDGERAPAGRIRRYETVADAVLYGYFLAASGGFMIAVLRSIPEPAHQAAVALSFLFAAFAVRQAAEALCEVARVGPILRRLRLLVDAPVDPLPTLRQEGEPAEDGGSLTLRHLTYRYPGAAHPAVQDVSLRVSQGEIVALTGPSGCGKSTLLRLVLGFHAPDAGDILRDGVPAATADLSAWREGVGAVLQDDELEQAKTIRGHIGGSDGYALADIREAARLAQLNPDLDAMPMGIQSIVDSERISTGQKQRILIARRLVRNPRLLILDEATNALPDSMQAEIFSAIRSLGISCLVVSHRVSALALADRVYRMSQGRVVDERAQSLPAEPCAALERTPEWTP